MNKAIYGILALLLTMSSIATADTMNDARTYVNNRFTSEASGIYICSDRGVLNTAMTVYATPKMVCGKPTVTQLRKFDLNRNYDTFKFGAATIRVDLGLKGDNEARGLHKSSDEIGLYNDVWSDQLQKRKAKVTCTAYNETVGEITTEKYRCSWETVTV